MRTEEAIRHVCKIQVYRGGNAQEPAEEFFADGEAESVVLVRSANTVKIWVQAKRD